MSNTASDPAVVHNDFPRTPLVLGRMPSRETRESSSPKSLGSAWAAWQATGAEAAGSYFVRCVSSWAEGTAEQLRRRSSRAGARAPSTADVQRRLREFLGVAARGRTTTYIQALEWARDAVADELRRARD